MATTSRDYLGVDYCREALSSIKLVQDLVSEGSVQLHVHQCDYLSSRMRDTGTYLSANLESLVGISSGNDIRRKALRHLHSTVKRAEMLVRGCCCEWESLWLEAAVTLVQIKEEVVDLVLDLRWWTSMVDIAIANVAWVSGGNLEEKLLEVAEEELLEVAEKDFQTLLDGLKLADNKLEVAFLDDKQHLLQRAREVLGSSAGQPKTHEYLLASHVRTRLDDSDLAESLSDVELNAHNIVSIIGRGAYGCVAEVEWLGRRSALKVLDRPCAKEAASLSSFHHPHIVQFLRYWEAARSSNSGRSSFRGSGTAMGGSPSPGVRFNSTEESSSEMQWHILMELLPTDLLRHMKRMGSKGLPQDVAIDVMLQITKAMWHLNNSNVAHRDLKPCNTLVQDVSSTEVPELVELGYLRVKLGDFGLVNIEAMSIASHSTTAKKEGTKLYMAPEVYVKDSNFSRQSRKFPRLADVWSFGIMFSVVLSGQTPFLDEQNRLGELHTKIQEGARPPLPRSCPEYLKFCITQCWQLRPQDRPSFADLWKLMRFAQVRSLGIIREDHDFFRFTTREGIVKRLYEQKAPPAEAGPNSSRSVLSKLGRVLLFSIKARLNTQTRERLYRMPSQTGMAGLGGARAYSLAEVKVATYNFSRNLGFGGFGAVYYGKLPDGKEVAVKVADRTSKQGEREFFNELDVLSQVHHKHLVLLVGYCQQQEPILIYEYVPNGSLFDHLHGKLSSLDWKMRLHIAENAAQGLEYLHTGCGPKFVHRNVKSGHILLTARFDAKVCGFGLAKFMGETDDTSVMTRVMGTAGYLDPEYFTTSFVSTKSDVYGFGIVLLELLSGHLPIDSSMTAVGKNPYIVEWVRECFQGNDMESILAPTVKASNPNMEGMWKVADIAMQCVEPKASHRPTMTEVVLELQSARAMEGGLAVMPDNSLGIRL